MAKINPIDIGVTTRKIRKKQHFFFQPAHWNVLGARITSHVKPMGWRRNGRSLVHFSENFTSHSGLHTSAKGQLHSSNSL